jgi:threonine/homoserine/homoserine lactone efflux protein
VTPYLLFGGGFAFAAAIQPGPLQAFLLARITTAGWRRTLPACLSPLVSDGPIALVALLALSRFTVTVQQALRVAGGGLLLYFAWGAFRQLRVPVTVGPGTSPPRTLFQAALVNLLNPNPYLGWALVLGPSAIAAWHQRPAFAVGLIVAFYGTMVAMLALFILLVGTAHFLGPRVSRALHAVSVLLLAVLGAWLVIAGVVHLAAPGTDPVSHALPCNGPDASGRAGGPPSRNFWDITAGG